MHSSTSNSDIHLTARTVPHGPWLRALVLALLALFVVVAGMEWALARKGFRATVIDSPSLWSKSRDRASALGENALILVGASRIQLDIDPGTLSRTTGKQVVQLAIDGSSFVPVLRSLADDDRVRGTVLVGYQDTVIENIEKDDAAKSYESAWERRKGIRNIPDFASAEGALSDRLHAALRSYADGARPLSSLLLRILPSDAEPQYLITLPDRSRMADYTRVEMPGFYFARVMRNMGLDSAPVGPTTYGELEAALKQRIAGMGVANMPFFDENSRVIGGLARKIEARGGRVVFVQMPTSGLVQAADDRRYPRQQFWNRFVSEAQVSGIHFEDNPGLRDFTCPDGSHLDFRDRVRFSLNLGGALQDMKIAPRRS